MYVTCVDWLSLSPALLIFTAGSRSFMLFPFLLQRGGITCYFSHGESLPYPGSVG